MVGFPLAVTGQQGKQGKRSGNGSAMAVDSLFLVGRARYAILAHPTDHSPYGSFGLADGAVGRAVITKGKGAS